MDDVTERGDSEKQWQVNYGCVKTEHCGEHTVTEVFSRKEEADELFLDLIARPERFLWAQLIEVSPLLNWVRKEP